MLRRVFGFDLIAMFNVEQFDLGVRLFPTIHPVLMTYTAWQIGQNRSKASKIGLGC